MLTTYSIIIIQSNNKLAFVSVFIFKEFNYYSVFDNFDVGTKPGFHRDITKREVNSIFIIVKSNFICLRSVTLLLSSNEFYIIMNVM